MAISIRVVTAATLAASLAMASAVHARDWHDHDRGGWHGDHHHGGGADAAVIGGLIGLGIGAAIASGGYGAPPPAIMRRLPATARHRHRPSITATESSFPSNIISDWSPR